MKSGKVFLGLLAGVAAGALLGILLAPDKGSATRRKFSKKGTDYVDGLKEKFNEFIEGVTETVESAKEEGRHIINKGKAKFDETKSEMKDGLHKNYSS